MIQVRLVLVCFLFIGASKTRSVALMTDEDNIVQSITSLKEILLGYEVEYHNNQGCTGVVIEELGRKLKMIKFLQS